MGIHRVSSQALNLTPSSNLSSSNLQLIQRVSKRSGSQSGRSRLSVEVFRRADGLTLIHQYIPNTPAIVADVWVNAGSIVEPDAWLGMAHFLEHMIFKGTARIAPGAFDRAIENRGGMTNAATSHDYAHFFITTATEQFAETLPYLADLLLHPSIPDNEFDRERLVVLEEIRQTYDSPDSIAFEVLMETAYQVHPYRRPILGTEDILMQRSPQEMRNFHQMHYQPDNMTIVVVGGLPSEIILDRVDGCFQDFLPPMESPPIMIEAEPPITGVRRQTIAFPRLELARLNLAWIGPGIDNLEDAYGLDLISVLLAGGRTSRLVRELREERQWVQWIDAQFSLQQDSSLFSISAGLEANYLRQVEEIVGDRLYQLQTQLVSEAELDRAKRQLCNDFAFSTETPMQLAGLYGYYYRLAGDITTALNYPDRLQAIAAEEIQRIACRYLSPYHYAATVVLDE
jgi:zinc protease